MNVVFCINDSDYLKYSFQHLYAFLCLEVAKSNGHNMDYVQEIDFEEN
jgi:hypothetical protein